MKLRKSLCRAGEGGEAHPFHLLRLPGSCPHSLTTGARQDHCGGQGWKLKGLIHRRSDSVPQSLHQNPESLFHSQSRTCLERLHWHPGGGGGTRGVLSLLELSFQCLPGNWRNGQDGQRETPTKWWSSPVQSAGEFFICVCMRLVIVIKNIHFEILLGDFCPSCFLPSLPFIVLSFSFC